MIYLVSVLSFVAGLIIGSVMKRGEVSKLSEKLRASSKALEAAIEDSKK